MNRCRPAYGFTPTLDVLDIPTAAASAGTLHSETSFQSDLLRIAAETSEEDESSLHQEGTPGDFQAEEPCNLGTVSETQSSTTTSFAFKRKLQEKGEAACARQGRLPTYAEVAQGKRTASPHRASLTDHHPGKEADSISFHIRSIRSRRSRAHQESNMEHLADRSSKDQEESSSGVTILPREKQSQIRRIYSEFCRQRPNLRLRRNTRGGPARGPHRNYRILPSATSTYSTQSFPKTRTEAPPS
ncbi:hypothetical protein GE061_018774 [Apolygus lucorum]|uniref:Uncharacterized protein n=1 Tax=Apolygus lucorum TaxID=248454 RepID=A0A8S9X7Z9_APOLU|nr:hypothetical protein GE061_018774 [Apolygus lucorum]